jgi:hypothetical protein
MAPDMTRCITIDDWVFEVKMVRALRVSDYGKPYNAIANLSLNGDQAFIDGMMNKSQSELSKKDHQAITDFCTQMGVKTVSFERRKNNYALSSAKAEQRVSRIVETKLKLA